MKHPYAAVAYISRPFLPPVNNRIHCHAALRCSSDEIHLKTFLPLRALLRWPCDQSPLGNVSNRLLSFQIATKTFDPLPLVCMIKALQRSELRKHSLVRLNDLLLT